MRIGLIVQDLNSDYSREILKGVEKYCSENNIELFVFIARSKNWAYGTFDYQYFACTSLVTENNLDGILLITNTYLENLSDEEKDVAIKQLRILPLVSIGAELEGVPSTQTNCKIGMEKLLEHLYKEHNSRRFAFMMPTTDSQDILDRKAAFDEFIKKYNIQFDPKNFIRAEYTFEAAQFALDRLSLSKENIDFDTLVTCGDDVAFGSIDYFRSKGIKVPRDLIVTGYDNQSRCEYSDPPLTSVDQRLDLQAYYATKNVHQLINDKNFKAENLLIDSEPVFRGSCCPNIGTENRTTTQSLIFSRTSQLTQFQFFLQAMQSTNTSAEMKEILMFNLQNFGFGSCVICTYDEPIKHKQENPFVLPERATVYAAYSESISSKDFESTVINPKLQIVPEGFKFSEGKSIIVVPLFNTWWQYGYALFTAPEGIDYELYEVIFNAVGIAISSSHVLFLKEKEAKTLEDRTVTDNMTQVLNREGLMKYGSQAIKNAIIEGKGGLVLFGDMNRLKRINDELGHEAGDRAILAEVKLLKESFRETDLIGRLGGDEFAIIAIGMPARKFSSVKRKLSLLSDNYNKNSGEPFNVSISLGFAEITADNHDLAELLNEADMHQYEEKRRMHKLEEKNK